MKKPIVIALVGIGAYLLWKKSQGSVNGLGSPYSDLSGLGKFSIKRAASAVASTAKSGIQAVVIPLRVAASPITALDAAAKVAVKGGNFKEVGQAAQKTLIREAMTPLTVPIKVIQPVLTKSMSQKLSNLQQRPGVRVAFGKPKPGTNNQPTAIVSSATLGPVVDGNSVWSPVPGQAGWEVCTTSDGSSVFRLNGAEPAFYCTPADLSQFGSTTGTVNMFLYGNPYGPGGAPSGGSSAPDTQSMPGTPDSTFVPSSSGQSSTAGQAWNQIADSRPYYPPGYDASQATMPTDPAQPSADGSQVMQQYQSPDAVAPAASGKINPLVVVGTFIAVPLAFMLTKGK